MQQAKADGFAVPEEEIAARTLATVAETSVHMGCVVAATDAISEPPIDGLGGAATLERAV